MSGRPADELCAGYETLRAVVTGQAACDTPRGLALMLSQGVPAWDARLLSSQFHFLAAAGGKQRQPMDRLPSSQLVV